MEICKKKKIEEKKKKNNKKKVKSMIQIVIRKNKMKIWMKKKLYYCKWRKRMYKTINKINYQKRKKAINKLKKTKSKIMI